MKRSLLILTLMVSNSYAARILAIMPIPSYSHQVVFQPLWRELSLRGYQVTLITTDPINDPTLTNLTEIDLRFAYGLWDGKNNLTGIINESANIVEMYMKFVVILNEIMDAELGHAAVQKIIKGADEQFDLLMVEYMQPTMFAFQHRFKIPMIGLVSLESHAIVPSYSHQIVPRPIWRELSLRGHQVTLMTCDPMNDPNLTNLTEIDMHAAYDLWLSKNLTENVSADTNVVSFLQMIFKMMNEVPNFELGMPAVQKIINGPDDQFDLLMVEYILPTFYAFQHKFKVPMIGIISMPASNMAHENMGDPTHPILYPELTLPFTQPLSFIGRLQSVGFSMISRYIYKENMKMEDVTIAKYFGPGYPTAYELSQNVDILLINANPVLQGVRPVVPSTVFIGGGIHLAEPKQLPQDIQTFLDNAKEGVVYFSLGSNVKSKDIPDKTRQIILETFRELPYKVLWKFEAETLEGKPDNVKIMKWIPQQDVLRHKNVKVFITQGGLQSTEEALFNYVPLVVMPFFGDQEMNAKRIELKGFGLSVDHKTLDKVKFTEILTEVIKNPKYRTTAKELAELALDEPMTGLDKAVWWTEYVIRHKGAKHLKGPAVNLPLYQYFFLDIIAFVSAILITVILILVFVVRFIKRLIFGKNKKKDNKKKIKTT